jgi:hypothetical protein
MLPIPSTVERTVIMLKVGMASILSSCANYILQFLIVVVRNLSLSMSKTRSVLSHSISHYANAKILTFVQDGKLI